MCKCNVIPKEVKSKYRLTAGNHYVMYTKGFSVWDLSLSVVIVCILWMAFFSGRLHWVDHY